MGKLWSTSIHEKQLFLTFFSFPIFRNRYNSDMRFNETLMVLEYTYLFGRNAYFSINK